MILNSIKIGQGTNNDNNSNGTIADHVYDDQKEDPPAASGKIILLTYVSSISWKVSYIALHWRHNGPHGILND